MLKVASRASTTAELVNSLCLRLGVGAPWETESGEVTRLIDVCRPHDEALLDMVDRETVPIAMMAYAAAKELRG